jgi:hypothetical protein
MYESATSVRVKIQKVPKGEFMKFLDPKQSKTSLVQLPFASPIISTAAEIDHDHAIYGALGLYLTFMGKLVTPSKPTAAIISRPTNLVNKYSITEDNRRLFPNEAFGPDEAVLENVNIAFGAYSEFRSIPVLFFLGARRGQGFLPSHFDPIMMLFDLMRGTGMTHVGAIADLLVSYPWCIKMTRVTPLVRKFVDEIKTISALDEDVRNYHRLIVPQSDFLFLSSEYRPLTALAAHVKKESESTFANYEANIDQYQDLIDEFESRRPNVTQVDVFDRLFKDLELPDLPLPQLSQSATAAVGPKI